MSIRQLAIAEQFHPAGSGYGARYLNLAELTRIDAYQPTDPSPLAQPPAADQPPPGPLFTTVIGRAAPRSVWLALPPQRLTGLITDTLRQVHHRLAAPPDHQHAHRSATVQP